MVAGMAPTIGPETSPRGQWVAYRQGMDRVKVTRRLAAGLGVVLILLGVSEVIRDVRAGDGGYVFWFVSLCGGGALILWGTFRPPARDPLALGMVVVGCLMAIVATMWTIVVCSSRARIRSVGRRGNRPALAARDRSRNVCRPSGRGFAGSADAVGGPL